MAPSSTTGHVKKVCGCAKWKDCAHPWYVTYRERKDAGAGGKVREPGLRCKLAPLVGREPGDFADAKMEARRAIVARKDCRDARKLLAGDAPTWLSPKGAHNHRPAKRGSRR
jgi:hypothetical protein